MLIDWLIDWLIDKRNLIDRPFGQCMVLLSSSSLSQGFWQGAAKNWELCGTMKVNCAAKKDQLCGKLCSSQFLISNVLGVAKWCFDWYFSLFKWWNQYYQLKSCIKVVLFWCQIGQRQWHIYLPEKIYSPPNTLLRTDILECIMYKILHINLFTHIAVYALFFLKFHLENQHAYYTRNPLFL